MAHTIYPPGPEETTKRLTALTTSYQIRAFLAIVSIFFFFILYFAMVAALGYLVYLAIVYPMPIVNRVTILLKLGAIAGSAMLFVFTLKFIFKLKNHQSPNRIKLNKKTQPELLEFVNEICRETGASRPKSIYIDPDVNAYVSYTNMWLSLFLPVRKNLTLGLGLIGSLNLSEFKAVTAHEFGHFAQRSMKIGSYIISANTIIHDMIFSRDSWDDTLARWRASDLRLSFPAWIITPLIWAIRQVLSLFYQFLNIMHASLSREMEFNADKVAVSLTGSEAIISALWKLEHCSSAWINTLNHAYTATQKNIYVKNIYEQFNLALQKISLFQNEILQSLPPDNRGGKRFFSNSKRSKTSMYASHPPNDAREHNAKIPFIDCTIDKRSPWILFNYVEEMQEKMTTLIYDQYFRKKPEKFASPQVFQEYIQAETQGSDLLSEYHGIFKIRNTYIPEQDELEKEANAINIPAEKALEALNARLAILVKPLLEIDSLMANAQQIANGETREKSFTFNNKTYFKKTIQEGYEALTKERKRIIANEVNQWDLSYFGLHFHIAGKLQKQVGLMNLYKQHKHLILFYTRLFQSKNSILSGITGLQAREELTHLEVDAFRETIETHITNLNKAMAGFDEANFVPLQNIDKLEELKEIIIEGSKFKLKDGKLFDSGAFDEIFQKIENALVGCQRINQKNMLAILALHKQLFEEYKAQMKKKKELKH